LALGAGVNVVVWGGVEGCGEVRICQGSGDEEGGCWWWVFGLIVGDTVCGTFCEDRGCACVSGFEEFDDSGGCEFCGDVFFDARYSL